MTWDGSYKVDKNGVLRILPEDEGKPLILLSPAYWREINEPRSPTSASRSTRPTVVGGAA